jgi:hypothetical protein
LFDSGRDVAYWHESGLIFLGCVEAPDDLPSDVA